MIKIGRIVFVFLIGIVQTSVGLAGDENQPIRLGRYRQLFIDDFLIAEMQGVQRVLNQPKKHPLNPLLIPDRPWEGAGFSHQAPSVKYDRKAGLFSMDYVANLPKGNRACRAVSKDGIHWEKPNWGMVVYEGSTANNLYRHKEGGPQGLHTPWDPDPQKQYKMLAGRNGPAMFSPDGYNWTTPPGGKKVTGVASDSSVMIVYDHVHKRYLGFSKTITVSNGHERRCRGITFSDDFLEWTRMKPILTPDARDDELARNRIATLHDRIAYDSGQQWHLSHFYWMRQVPYQGMFVGIVLNFDVSGWPPGMARKPSAGGENGLTYYELASSRDREHWSRVGNRKIFIPVGEAGTWEAAKLSFPPAPIIVDDQMRFYYGGRQSSRSTTWFNLDQPEVIAMKKKAKTVGAKYASSGIGLATLRLDGWVSIDAGSQPGTLTTKPVVFDPDKKLVINALAAKGSVAVEILYTTGQPISGFSASDCDSFSGDDIRHTVTWNGKSDLSKVTDHPVQIRFHLKNAKLFSFQSN